MTSQQPIILGITGGIACGKTEAGCILAEEGFVVLDTDALAHEMMRKDLPVYQRILGRFGAGILDADGEIDRRKLGEKVFNDTGALEDLNRLVHPPVLAETGRWRKRMRETGRDGAALIPLLFEANAGAGWDAVICVTAPEEQVFQRLEKRGLSGEEARKRIAAQMPLAEKAAKADFVIENSGTLEMLKDRMTDLVEKIRRKKEEEL